MLENTIYGMIQGVAEWLPVSSEGLIVLAHMAFGGIADLDDILRLALFLHMGTFFAALAYFWREVFALARAPFIWKQTPKGERAVFRFLAVATAVTALIGGSIWLLLGRVDDLSAVPGSFVMVAIGLLLLVTAWLQLRVKRRGTRTVHELTVWDALLTGGLQGFSVLPGISRSGSTVAMLLIRKIDDTTSLHLSFLMSLPVVLGANIVLNADKFVWNPAMFAGLVASFFFGLVTIHWLLKLARQFNFGYFVLAFGILTILAGVITYVIE
ncbi:MAG: undecaprenyl-diphosphate phosphatase [Candidatus Spechtbacterales bacterium]